VCVFVSDKWVPAKSVIDRQVNSGSRTSALTAPAPSPAHGASPSVVGPLFSRRRLPREKRGDLLVTHAPTSILSPSFPSFSPPNRKENKTKEREGRRGGRHWYLKSNPCWERQWFAYHIPKFDLGHSHQLWQFGARKLPPETLARKIGWIINK